MRPIPPLEDVIEWDVPNWAVSLKYWREHTHLNTVPLRALEIGCGHGGLSLWAASTGMEVLCTDLEGPSREAREKHGRYGVADRIRYGALNALDIPFRQEFDVILFKSVLGGVGRGNNRENQVKAVHEIHKALKRGGELWFAENLAASPFHRFFRSRFVPWGKTWRYVTVREMLAYLSVFSEVDFTTAGFLGGFGRTPFQRTVLGSMDRLVADRLVPETWRYIMIGIARK